MTLTPRAKRVIDLAYDEARNLNNNYIGTEHLLLGLIREADGLAGRVLDKLGVELEKARRTVMDVQGEPGNHPPDMPSAPSAPRRYHRPEEGSLLLQRRQGRFAAEHLFLVLVESPNSEAENIFARAVSQHEWVLGKIEDVILYTSPENIPEVSADLVAKLFERAHELAVSFGGAHAAPRHLLLAIAERSDLLIGKLVESYLPDIRNAVETYEK